MDPSLFNALDDPRAGATLQRLHREAGRLYLGTGMQLLRHLPRLLLTRQPISSESLLERGVFDQSFLAVEPQYGVFLYQLARALRARHIVEFGTSFGLSTIYLALAVRDNGGGRVIGTELVAGKALKAREHLREAGVEEFVEIRVGNAHETLAGLEDEVDLHLNDGFPKLSLPVLRQVAPRLRPGAVVLNPNSALKTMKDEHADYLAWVRDPANGFRSQALSGEFGEFSVKA